jgi:hypothetical protein
VKIRSANAKIDANDLTGLGAQRMLFGERADGAVPEFLRAMLAKKGHVV